MSFRCVIITQYTKEKPGQPIEQVSPLRFATEKEALGFGTLMFELPRTVESWDIEQIEEPANYNYKKGKLIRLLKESKNEPL